MYARVQKDGFSIHCWAKAIAGKPKNRIKHAFEKVTTDGQKDKRTKSI
jgi:hypothetical protein